MKIKKQNITKRGCKKTNVFFTAPCVLGEESRFAHVILRFEILRFAQDDKLGFVGVINGTGKLNASVGGDDSAPRIPSLSEGGGFCRRQKTEGEQRKNLSPSQMLCI